VSPLKLLVILLSGADGRHDAQICYCGEPNCVGFIGGKTQTDSSLGTMNDLFLDGEQRTRLALKRH
jgi:hypothetical protein